MSTLPALIDELRKCEREWDGSNMFELARMCRDAADMLDENAELRHDLEDANNQAEEVCIENAKLRELVRIAGTYCVNGLCGKDDGCPLYLGKPYCALPDRMRELGIEVGA